MLLFAKSISSFVLVFPASNKCHEVVGRGREREARLYQRRRIGGAVGSLLGGWGIGHDQYRCDTTRCLCPSRCLYILDAVLLPNSPYQKAKEPNGVASPCALCAGELSDLQFGASGSWRYAVSKAGQTARYVLSTGVGRLLW